MTIYNILALTLLTPTPTHSLTAIPILQVLATGSWDHRIQLRSVESSGVIATLKSHIGAVTALTFSPNGRSSYPNIIPNIPQTFPKHSPTFSSNRWPSQTYLKLINLDYTNSL